MQYRIRTAVAATAGLSMLGAGLSSPARAAAPDACEDAGSSCTIVSRADVDGDGVRDSVSQVAWGGQADGTGKVTTRVVTADGERMSTVTEHDLREGAGYFGAAEIDGEDGYEIVTRTTLGAHTAHHQVLTYRDGRLTSLQDPHNRYRWITDSSAWSAAGYERTTTADGDAKLLTRTAVDDDRDGDYTMTLRSSSWNTQRKTWQRLGETTRHDLGEEEVRRAPWWRVPGLPYGV